MSKTDLRPACYSLPFCKPPLVSFLSWAYTLSIVCQYPETEGWLFNNFIQLACTTQYLGEELSSESEQQMVLDFWRGGLSEMLGNNPFLESRVLGYDHCLGNLDEDSILQIICESLKDNFYPMVFLDESMLPFSTEYGTGNPFPHHVLIHSISSSDETIGVLGFGRTDAGGDYGRLSSHLVSFKDLQRATVITIQRIKERAFSDQLSYLLRYRSSTGGTFFYEKQVSVRVIKESLTQYLSGCDKGVSNPPNYARYAFGVAVYEELARYFMRVSAGRISPKHRRDVRHLHVLEEHNNLMVKRIECLEKGEAAHPSIDLHSIKAEFRSIAQGLRLMKLMLMMRIGWQDQADLRAVAQRLRELGIRNERVVSKLHNLL